MKKLLLLITLIILAICLSSCTKEPTLMETLESVQSNPSVASSEDIDSDNTEGDASMSEIELIESYIDKREKVLTIVTDEYLTIDEITLNAVNMYLAELGTEYKVDFEYLQSSNYREDLYERIDKDLPSDIIFTGVLYYDYYFNNDYLLPLSSYLNSEEGEELKNSIPNKIWELLKRNDEIYGISALLPSPENHGYIVNIEYMQKYKLDKSELNVNVDRLYELLSKVYNEEGITPLYANLSDLSSVDYHNYLGIFAVDYEEKKVSYIFDVAEAEIKLKTYKDYLNQNLIGDSNTLPTDFSNVFLIYESNYSPYVEEYPLLTETGEFAQLNEDYIFIPLQQSLNINLPITMAYGISSNTESKEESLDFITKVMTDKKLSDFFIHGIENVHYTLSEENKILPILNSEEALYKEYVYRGNTTKIANEYISTLYNGLSDETVEIAYKYYEEAKITEFAKIDFNISEEILNSVNEKSLHELEKILSEEDLESVKYMISEFGSYSLTILLNEFFSRVYSESAVTYEEEVAIFGQQLDNSGGQEIIAEIEKILLENGVK